MMNWLTKFIAVPFYLTIKIITMLRKFFVAAIAMAVLC